MPMAPIYLQYLLGAARVIHIHWQHPSGCGHDLNNEGPPHRPCDSVLLRPLSDWPPPFPPQSSAASEHARSYNFGHPVLPLCSCTCTEVRTRALQRQGQGNTKSLLGFRAGRLNLGCEAGSAAPLQPSTCTFRTSRHRPCSEHPWTSAERVGWVFRLAAYISASGRLQLPA